jgi:alpha-glucosidase (family GH31 glycosyl hydrolase)
MTTIEWNPLLTPNFYSNTYGSHAFYLDTRYYEVNDKGSHTLVSSDQATTSKNYVSYSHGVFLRNAHGQEILLGTEKLTWRTIGGSIDLTLYSGPTQREVTKDYQLSTIGLPAMQQYFTFGYHQCRWGYTNWSEVEDVVANFQKFEIPLENIWYVDTNQISIPPSTVLADPLPGTTLTTCMATVTLTMTRTAILMKRELCS